MKYSECQHGYHIAHSDNTWEKCVKGCALEWTTNDGRIDWKKRSRTALIAKCKASKAAKGKKVK